MKKESNDMSVKSVMTLFHRVTAKSILVNKEFEFPAKTVLVNNSEY